MVPAFEGIAEDAERATKAEYERLGAMPYGDQIDMSDVAEMANDHGIAYYETMSGVRQGVLNVLAVGLYHLFEQQQLFFLRRGLLSRAEDVPTLFKVAEWRCCTIQPWRESGRFHNPSFMTPRRRTSACRARPSG